MDLDPEDSQWRKKGEEIPQTPGRVYLVGAGPGDPSLLTLRASELLKSADLVVLDSLVSPEIVTRIGSHARIVDAARKSGKQPLSREEVTRMLIEEGAKGKVVVRLKGGDPFVFGRGGEEAESLRDAGIAFEIVPGISSAIAAPAYAGIPITHPRFTNTVAFVTGLDGELHPETRWEALAKLGGTLVFLLGSEHAKAIAEHLVARGLDPDTPAAVIASGTTRRQRTIAATVGTLGAKVADSEHDGPSLVVIGRVVELQQSISWFESKPLFGRTIVVTRARPQAGGLVRLLETDGATVVQFPMIEVTKPESWDSLDAILAELPDYQWLIFTSANGVDAFFDRLQHHGRDLRALTSTRIAAVGEATAGAFHSRGIIPDLVPEKYQAAALLPHFAEKLDGERIGIVRAAAGGDELIDELRQRGARVDVGAAYETRPTRGFRDQVGSMLGSRKIDAITFTSSSTVDNFFEQLSADERQRAIEEVSLASIGPVTSQTIRAHGAEPTIEAPEATVSSLAQAIVEHFRKGRGQ